MKSALTNSFLGLLLGVLFFSSCVSDTVVVEESDLMGRWEVKEAYRDGKVTQMLNGFYFEFSENGKLKSNFNQQSEDMDYGFTIQDNKIMRTGKDNLEIKFDKPSEDELILETALSGANFKLVIGRIVEEG